MIKSILLQRHSELVRGGITLGGLRRFASKFRIVYNDREPNLPPNERRKRSYERERFLRSLPIHHSETESFDTGDFILWKNPSADSIVYNFTTGSPLGLMKISSRIFALPPRLDHIYTAKIYESSWLEDASYTTLCHGEIKSTGRKPYPQKGTGMPAAGSFFSAQRIGGYKSHGARPHDPRKKVNQNVYDCALRSVLSSRYFEGALTFVDSMHLDTSNSNIIPHILKTFGINDCECTYFIYGGLEPEHELIETCNRYMLKKTKSNKNTKVLVSSVKEMILHSLLISRQVFLDIAAVEYIEGKYKDESVEAQYLNKIYGEEHNH